MAIIDTLEKLNFTTLEAKIYLALLEGGEMSAYQLAKKIDISRPSIYNALEHMVEKGMAVMVPEKTALYGAQEPELLLSKLQKEMTNSLKTAKSQLSEYKNSRHQEQILYFKGYDMIILKAKEMLKQATKEVYINADFDLTCFQEEFQELVQKGIRVVVFSFYHIEIPCEGVELYTHHRTITKNHLPSRLMVAINEHSSFVANCNSEFDGWSGVFNSNSLSVKIITEHIHNDIYLWKLRETYGKEMYENVYIETDFERKSRGAFL